MKINKLIILLFILIITLISCNKGSKKFKIILIGTSECNACNESKKIYNEILKKFKNKIKFIYYDISTDEGKKLFNDYNGKSLPLSIFFNSEGKVFFVSQSKLPEDAIIAILNAEGFK